MAKTLKLSSLVFAAFIICSCNDSSQEPPATAAVEKSITSNTSPALKSAPALPKDQLAKAYTSAIAEYIKAAKDHAVFDTLFIGKQADFPDIRLPENIEGTGILQITYEDYMRQVDSRKPRVYLNVIGWVEKEKPEFLIVTFLDEGKPQHNCHLFFKRHSDGTGLELDSLGFEYPYNNIAPKK